MKKLAESAECIVAATEQTESPIEGVMFSAFMRDPNFIICMTEDAVQGCGIFVRTQVPIGPYKADFLVKAVGFDRATKIWPPNVKEYYAIECDGHEFHSSPEQISHDKKRDEYFSKRGIKTLRFTGSQINKDAEKCLNHIHQIIRMSMV